LIFILLKSTCRYLEVSFVSIVVSPACCAGIDYKEILLGWKE